MYHGPATGVAGAGGAAALGGTGTVAGAAGALPFTGLAYNAIWALMLGMLLVALGVMLIRAGRLVTGERATKAEPFARGAAIGRQRT